MGKILDKFRSEKSSVKEDNTEIISEPNEGENSACEQEIVTTAQECEVSESENQTETEPKVTSVPKEQPKRSTIRVCKMGSDHNFANMNNHDFAFNLLNMKIVMDGCGSGKHSEVGTRLFGQLFARRAKEYFDKGESICEENFIEVVNGIFYKLLGLCSDTSFIFNNYCFTILVFDSKALKEYKEGVQFKVTRFAKTDYFNVGVASDGLRYAENLLEIENNKLLKFLHEGKGPQIEVLINRNNRKNEMFHDDISICF